jgi:hypothetical protein
MDSTNTDTLMLMVQQAVNIWILEDPSLIGYFNYLVLFDL